MINAIIPFFLHESGKMIPVLTSVWSKCVLGKNFSLSQYFQNSKNMLLSIEDVGGISRWVNIGISREGGDSKTIFTARNHYSTGLKH